MTDVLCRFPTHTLFTIGDLLIHHNQWRGWDQPEDQTWFKSLTWGTYQALQVDDEVWLDDEPKAGTVGKVYGRRLVRITDIEKGPKRMRIWYNGGMLTVCEDQALHKLAVLTDEKTVWDWTEHIPNAREC